MGEIFDGDASGIMKDIDYVKENNYVKKMFFNYLKESGYEILDCVAVNSKIDSSVFLVGSCTNVFKPIFLSDRISDFGHFIIQPSINSKYVDCLYNDALERYSSNYITLGVLDRYDNLSRIMHTAFEFLLKMFDAKSLSVRANSIDTDFTRIISRDYNEIKLILCGGDKCRNHFGTYNGLQICGRCIQFFHYNENACSDECFANLSVYEYNGDCVGVEFSTTVAAINIERFNFKNTNEVNVLKSVSDNMNIKLLECISTVAILIKDGVRPNSSQMSGRIFKKYNRALAYLVEKQKISYEEVIELIRKYVNLEFDTDINKADEEIIGMVLKK